jgi:hypothetical protein
MSITVAMQKGFEESMKEMVKELAWGLSSTYGLDEGELLERMSSMLSIKIASKSVGSSSSSSSNRRVDEEKESKPSFFLPWCGSYRSGWCMGLRPNGGLYSQCTVGVRAEGERCESCKRKGMPSPAAGARSSDEWTYKTKRPMRYANWLSKKGITAEAARAEAAKFGLEIPELEMKMEIRQRGRPRKTAAVSDSESDSEGGPVRRKRGRPSKKEKSGSDGDDLFASILASQEKEEGKPEVKVEKKEKVSKPKIGELRAELKALGLSTEGKKGELMARLEEWKNNEHSEASPEMDLTATVVPEVSPEMELTATVKPEAGPEMELTATVKPEAGPEMDLTATVKLEAGPEIDLTGAVKPEASPGMELTATVKPEAVVNVEMKEEVYEEETEDEEEATAVKPFIHDGVKYLKSEDNDLYDPETMEHIAYWNGETVEELEEEEE